MTAVITDIHRKLAPFLVTGLSGPKLTQEEGELLAAAPPAGVILFHRNVESVQQLRTLTGEVMEIIGKASGSPPLIMADHEGGRISVLAKAIGAPPSPMAIGRSGGKALVTLVMSRTARRMRNCGINLSLSPVADVNTEPLNPVIGTRSFGEEPGPVSESVRAAVRAIASEGMLSCLKHFPGHGATAVDSHLALPVTGRTLDELGKVELIPFIAGIEEGADTVMTAHIALEEGGMPVSLDRRIVTGLLREKLGFDGVVITDALEMGGALPDGKAMSSIDPEVGEGKSADAVPAAVIPAALEAGNDLLLMSRPVGEVYSELAGSEEFLAGKLADMRLGESAGRSAARISALRGRVPAAVPESPLDEPEAVCGNLPGFSVFTIPPGRQYGFPDVIRPVFIGWKGDFDSPVTGRFISRVYEGLGRAGLLKGPAPGPDAVEPFWSGGDPRRGLYSLGPAQEDCPGKVLVLLCRRQPPEDQVRRAAAGCEAVVVAGRPWDASMVPESTPLVITYGIYDGAADQLADILGGSGRDPSGEEGEPKKSD
jgi:beta-glucosidase-like glycosyl hydrolase